MAEKHMVGEINRSLEYSDIQSRLITILQIMSYLAGEKRKLEEKLTKLEAK